MDKPYSLDLRERTIGYVEQGYAARAAARVLVYHPARQCALRRRIGAMAMLRPKRRGARQVKLSCGAALVTRPIEASLWSENWCSRRSRDRPLRSRYGRSRNSPRAANGSEIVPAVPRGYGNYTRSILENFVPRCDN
jgi:hypothetical protein